MTDQELLAELHRRPNAALSELARRYAPLASSIARRILPGRRADVEEVAADTLIRIWQNGERLNGETLRGFVITTARNLSIDRWRQLRRREEVPLFDGEEEPLFLEEELHGNLLAEWIGTLSPPDGEIFLRHCLLLETAAEIGRRYGLTESAVRARLHRIRKVLQKEVAV